MSRLAVVQAHKHALVEHACSAKDVSYCPYSKFRVGAALLLDHGSYVIGANVENASYGCAICAERSAVAKYVTDALLRKRKIIAIAITSDASQKCPPCGICRQVLREFCDPDVIFLLAANAFQPAAKLTADPTTLAQLAEPHLSVTTMQQLLPDSFGPESLAL